MAGRLDIGSAPPGVLDMDNLSIVEEFLASLEAAGASPQTVKAYRAALMDFIGFLGDKPLRETGPREYNAWRMHRLRNGFPGSRGRGGRQGRLATLHYYSLFVRRFLRWLGLGFDAPVTRRPRRRVDALSEEEVRRLLDAARDPLDMVILRLLLDTGMRSRELLGLRVGDILFDEGVIVVREAKYGGERRVLATRETLEVLRAWIRLRGLGPRDPVVPLSYSGLYKRIRRLGERAGIPREKARPHILRHTFATRALRRGMSLPAVQRLLGHSDIKVTEIYTHLTLEDIRREYRRLEDEAAAPPIPAHGRAVEPRFCPRCGRPWVPGARFCPYCGYDSALLGRMEGAGQAAYA